MFSNYLKWEYLKIKFQEYFFKYQRIDDLYPNDTVAIIASTHGDITAYKKILDYLEERKCKMIFHAGDIMDEHGGAVECLVETLENPKIYPVLGNHDLLILKKDYIHNYMDNYISLAKVAYNKILKTPDLEKKVMEIPIKIDTKYFSIVHESVDSPYYAKLTKKRKKNHQFGQSVDENAAAVFSGSLKHPYFIGADHAGYIIDAKNMTYPRYLKPGTKFDIFGSKIISVPSVSLSKDANYQSGCVIVKINENGSLNIEMVNLNIETNYIINYEKELVTL
jgi:predicted phosphodiesterase